ncbi:MULTISPECIES: DUF2934 domain-containing protein [Oxalobacteraceae]|jgi:hypothetical protein|uniref:DUF2934 domain-containing protein n=1 Tax=Oxalobacteraceae TaxID=75682 RepID=UPI0010A345D8|nr:MULTISPECIES: DUF2934 domain-containing protein [Oxalobacteraceae]
MANTTNVSLTPRDRSGAFLQGDITPAQREQMIREAAYFQSARRGFAPGHDLDDWLAAETELFGEEFKEEFKAPEPVDATEFEVQQGGPRGARQDDALKQIVRQHPQRGIPQVEGIEIQEAPPRE